MGLNGAHGGEGSAYGGGVHGSGVHGSGVYGRGTGGSAADDSAAREIRVDISELVFDGFHGDPDLVLAAFETELARLLREQGVPLAADGAPRTLDALAGLPPLPATVSVGRLGEALARSVHAGLAGDGEPRTPAPHPYGRTYGRTPNSAVRRRR